jgi:hypothetical protein
VAAALQPYIVDDYVCGLWKPEFLQGLLWRTAGNTLSRRIQGHAPSWPWASVTSEIKYGFGTPVEGGEWAQQVDIEIKKTTANPYGPAHGLVTLRGPLGVAVAEAIDSKWNSVSLRLDVDIYCKKAVMLVWYPDVTDEAGEGEKVHLFSVFTKRHSERHPEPEPFCLVLKQTG